jgi:hypothetical protein
VAPHHRRAPPGQAQQGRVGDRGRRRRRDEPAGQARRGHRDREQQPERECGRERAGAPRSGRQADRRDQRQAGEQRGRAPAPVVLPAQLDLVSAGGHLERDQAALAVRPDRQRRGGATAVAAADPVDRPERPGQQVQGEELGQRRAHVDLG